MSKQRRYVKPPEVSTAELRQIRDDIFEAMAQMLENSQVPHREASEFHVSLRCFGNAFVDYQFERMHSKNAKTTGYFSEVQIRKNHLCIATLHFNNGDILTFPCSSLWVISLHHWTNVVLGDRIFASDMIRRKQALLKALHHFRDISQHKLTDSEDAPEEEEEEDIVEEE